MASAVPHVFIYEYPALGGPPLGTLDAAEELLEDQAALQAFGACVGLLAVPEEDEGYAIVGGVFRHDHERSTWALHVLVRWQGQGLALQRDEVAQVLTNGAYFRERHAEEPWIDFFDVALWLQYESNYSLIFLMDEIARAFLPAQ